MPQSTAMPSPTTTTDVAIPADLSAKQAIPLLVDAHGGRLYGLGLKLCGNPADAEDLVQEVFLQAFRKWHQFEGRSDPSSWLYTIGARACQRMHRRRSGEPSLRRGHRLREAPRRGHSQLSRRERAQTKASAFLSNAG